MSMKIALMGAGGKMGCRISENMKSESDFEMLNVEISEQGIKNLESLGLSTTPPDEAIGQADAVVLAIPDKLIGKVSKDLVPKLKPGTLLIGLDPAAAYAEVMPVRDDIDYFVCHPCHPPMLVRFETEEAGKDWFGGKAAPQSAVCALYHGKEEAYAMGEKIAAAMFKPILRMHRITVEQMAILEPGVVETFAASCLLAIKEMQDEAIRMGVPEQAAIDFVHGHMRTITAISFDVAGFPFSDGAKHAIQSAQSKIFRDDWRDVLKLDNIKKSVKEITDSVNA